jgi:hypothetical protein
VSDSFEFKIIPEPIKSHPIFVLGGDEAAEHRRSAEATIGWRSYQKTKKFWNDDLENRYQHWLAAEREYWQNFLLATDRNPVSLKRSFRCTWTQDIGQRTDYAESGLMLNDLRETTRKELGIEDILKSLEEESLETK